MDLLTTLGRFAYGLVGLALFLHFRGRSASPRWVPALLWTATRVGGAVLLYGVLRLDAPTDTAAWYIVQARGALAGGLPYRDFDSSFAPLFPAVLGAFALVWNSPYVFVAAAILLEGILLMLWTWLGPRLVGAEPSRLAVLAYLCSVLPLNTAIMGQDEIGVACLLTVAIILVDRNRWAAGAAVCALMLVVTKFTSLLYWPFLASRSNHLWRFGGLAAALAAPVYIAIQFAGADVLAPLRFEGGLFTNGNGYYVLGLTTAAWVRNPLVAQCALVVLMVALGVLWFHYRARRPRSTLDLLQALVVAEIVFLLLFKKSYHVYLATVAPALCLVFAARRPAWLPLVLVLNLLSVVQQSLFFRVMGTDDLSRWRDLAASPVRLSFVAADIASVVGYAAVAVAILRMAPGGERQDAALSAP